MNRQLVDFWKDEEGATAIEYGLIAALIAVAIIGTLGLLGGSLSGMFDQIKVAVDGAMTGGGTED